MNFGGLYHTVIVESTEQVHEKQNSLPVPSLHYTQCHSPVPSLQYTQCHSPVPSLQYTQCHSLLLSAHLTLSPLPFKALIIIFSPSHKSVCSPVCSIATYKYKNTIHFPRISDRSVCLHNWPRQTAEFLCIPYRQSGAHCDCKPYLTNIHQYLNITCKVLYLCSQFCYATSNTNYSAEDPHTLRNGRSGFRFPVGTRYFFLLQNVQTGSGSHSASHGMGRGGPFPVVKRSELEVTHLPLVQSLKMCGAVLVFLHTP